jgi:hypothetical protein
MDDAAWSADPYQGATMGDLTLWEYWRAPGAKGTPRYLREDPPPGVVALAMRIAVDTAKGILSQPDRWRAELERVRAADEWRRRYGYPIVLDARGLAHYESQIAEAEERAADLRRRLGLLEEGDVEVDVEAVLAELTALG